MVFYNKKIRALYWHDDEEGVEGQEGEEGSTSPEVITERKSEDDA